MLRARMLLLVLPLIGACSPSPEAARLAESVGSSLIARSAEGAAGELAGSRDLPGVVHVGSGLAHRLDELRPGLDGECAPEVEAGDAPEPIGDGRAIHRLYLVCGGERVLGLRLRYRERAHSFDLLGYWTP